MISPIVLASQSQCGRQGWGMFAGLIQSIFFCLLKLYESWSIRAGDYVDYTIHKGKRDNAPQTYDGVHAFKTRLSGLVVVHTLESYTAPTILTSYWAKSANLKVFERLLSRTPQTASQRRANWRNKIWEFWFMSVCMNKTKVSPYQTAQRVHAHRACAARKQIEN